jgi:hypothetical protein
MFQLSSVPEFPEGGDRPNLWPEHTARALGQLATDVSASAGQLSAAADAFAAEAARLIAEAAREHGYSTRGAQDASAAQGIEELKTMGAAVVEAVASAKNEVAGGLNKGYAVHAALEEVGRELRDQIAAAATEAVGRVAAEGNRQLEQLALAGYAATTQLASQVEGIKTSEVLDRLETDYKLLRALVADLHQRVVGLGRNDQEASQSRAATQAEEPSDERPDAVWGSEALQAATDKGALQPLAEPASGSPTFEASVEPQDPNGTGDWHGVEVAVESTRFRAPVAAAPWAGELEWITPSYARAYQIEAWHPEPVRKPEVATETTEHEGVGAPGATFATAWDAPVPEPAVGTTSASAEIWVEGRIRVDIEPVPDFDRLLNLDTALNRLPSVGSVTLADYSNEQVTFRLEMTEPAEAGEIASHLSGVMGLRLDVTSAEPDRLQLRLSAA